MIIACALRTCLATFSYDNSPVSVTVFDRIGESFIRLIIAEEAGPIIVKCAFE